MSILERIGMYSIGLFTKDPKQILAYYRLDLNDFTKKKRDFHCVRKSSIPFHYHTDQK